MYYFLIVFLYFSFHKINCSLATKSSTYLSNEFNFYETEISAIDDCDAKSTTCSKIETIDKKYLFFDINPSEGFNLRRDVYMRVAALIKTLNRSITLKKN